MSEKLNRRSFIRQSVAASAGASLGLGIGAQPADAEKPIRRGSAAETANKGMPMGKIGNLKISRLISGGNLISGWSHARDLIYVHHLMRHYNTDEKVMETLELLEEQGVNTIIADPSERPYRIFPKYWNERGGKIQWIAEGHPDIKDLRTDIKKSLDYGCAGV